MKTTVIKADDLEENTTNETTDLPEEVFLLPFLNREGEEEVSFHTPECSVVGMVIQNNDTGKTYEILNLYVRDPILKRRTHVTLTVNGEISFYLDRALQSVFGDELYPIVKELYENRDKPKN